MIGLNRIDFMCKRKSLIITLIACFLSIFVANVSALTTHRSFDFDCDDGGVETMTGWTSFPISAYDPVAGYGWNDTSGINCVKRLSGDALQKDLHYASVDKTFRVDLPNGKYTVRVYMGDMGGYAHDNMDVSAEGNLMLHNVSTAAGEVEELSFDVAVSDRQLSLLFHDNGGTDLNWVVNGIEIVQNEVVVTSPDGGETLNGGKVYFITWTTSATKKPVANTLLSYSIDSGDTWKRIAISPGNLGWFPWQVPIKLSEKDDCKVKVTLKDSLGRVLGTDTSNESFTIAATCNTWQALCSGACVNLQTDSKNCGACGNACPEGQTCSAGSCTSI